MKFNKKFCVLVFFAILLTGLSLFAVKKLTETYMLTPGEMDAILSNNPETLSGLDDLIPKKYRKTKFARVNNEITLDDNRWRINDFSIQNPSDKEHALKAKWLKNPGDNYENVKYTVKYYAAELRTQRLAGTYDAWYRIFLDDKFNILGWSKVTQ